MVVVGGINDCLKYRRFNKNMFSNLLSLTNTSIIFVSVPYVNDNRLNQKIYEFNMLAFNYLTKCNHIYYLDVNCSLNVGMTKGIHLTKKGKIEFFRLISDAMSCVYMRDCNGECSNCTVAEDLCFGVNFNNLIICNSHVQADFL